MALMVSCKPKTPRQFIQPDEMENILVDYHLAMSMAEDTPERGYNKQYYLESVLQKHGVTRADFDSSLVYYYTRSDRFDAMYKRVADRLEEKALALGATEGEIGRYSSLKGEGDTANIWAEKNMMVMRPMPPYNRYDFALPADTTFRRGDSFLMQFMLDYMYQDGNKEGMVYVAVDYPDTIMSYQQRISYSGLIQLRIPANNTADIKGIRGYFFLGGVSEPTTTQRLLFVNNIQLIRFHPERHEDEPIKTDSIPSGTDARRANTETISR